MADPINPNPYEMAFLRAFRALGPEQRQIIMKIVWHEARAEPSPPPSARIVKFPTRRIVRQRYCRDQSNPELAEIIRATDSVEGAIKALRAQYKSLWMTWRNLKAQQDAEESGEGEGA